MIEIRVDNEGREPDELQRLRELIQPQNIYDDVAQLQTEVETLKDRTATIQQQVDTLTPSELTTGEDLNELPEGFYIIPNGAVAGSLVNKPAGVTTETGTIEVTSGGSAGQRIQYYTPCRKETTKYFTRVYYSGSWGAWQEIDNTDTGWLDLPLTSAATAYNEAQKPRYRRIGKAVYITGVIKGVDGNDQHVATLPAGCKPSMRAIYTAGAGGGTVALFTINTDGKIELNRNTGGVITTGTWHSIACSFCI